MNERVMLMELFRSHPVRTVWGVNFSVEFHDKAQQHVVFRFVYIKENGEEMVFFSRHFPLEDYLRMATDQLKDFYIHMFDEAHKQLKIVDVGEV
jgi:hypothetical protein